MDNSTVVAVFTVRKGEKLWLSSLAIRLVVVAVDAVVVVVVMACSFLGIMSDAASAPSWPGKEAVSDLDRVQTSRKKIRKRLKGGKPFLTL